MSEPIRATVPTFAAVPPWVLAHPVMQANRTALHVYVAMYLDANWSERLAANDWRAVATRTGLQRATIYRDLKRMRDAGIVRSRPDGSYYMPLEDPSTTVDESTVVDGSSTTVDKSSTTVDRTLYTEVQSLSRDRVVDDVDELCAILATAVAKYRGDDTKRPKVTARWRTDMRLLLERGPLHRDAPSPTPRERVERCIGFVFERLAEPGRDGFCWAAQVRSPHALRDHWDQLLDAGKRIAEAQQRAPRRAPLSQLLQDAVNAENGHRPLEAAR